MIIELTQCDSKGTPISYFVDKIVLFMPAGEHKPLDGRQMAKTRIIDVTDAHDRAIGTTVVEDYEFVKALIENAISGKQSA